MRASLFGFHSSQLKLLQASRLLIGASMFIFMTGSSLMAAGAFMWRQSILKNSKVVSLLDNISDSGSHFGTAILAMMYMMIILGGLLVLTSLFGMCISCGSRGKLLNLVIILSVVLFLLEAPLCSVWRFILNRTADEWFIGEMLILLRNYEGPEMQDDISVGWNTLFIEGRCCGVNTQYSDGSINDFMDLPTNWWANRGSSNIPASCCRGADFDTILQYDDQICTQATPPMNFYTVGCFERMKSTVTTYAVITLVMCSTSFLGQIMGLLAVHTIKHNNISVHIVTKTQRENPIRAEIEEERTTPPEKRKKLPKRPPSFLARTSSPPLKGKQSKIFSKYAMRS